MRLSTNDPIKARSRVTPNDVMRGIGETADSRPDVWRLANALDGCCTFMGYDFALLIAQSDHECFNPETGKHWDSFWWKTEKNPAGIGIFDDGSTQRIAYANEEQSARAMVAHMAAYVGDKPPDSWIALDPRYHAAVAAFGGSVRTLGDLGGGRWATDPQYAVEIVARGNALVADMPERQTNGGIPVAQTPVVFGRVPKPPIVELICAKAGPGHGYYEVSPRSNVGVCEHITDGHGSIEWYHDFFSVGGERADDALVDFIIGRDGRIGMLNDPWGTRAPWANGNTAGLEGDGPAFIAKFGVDAVNTRLISIEHEGFAAEDWTGAQWNAAVNLDAWLYDQMHVRHDSFPIHQDYRVDVHLLHSYFTNKGGNGLDECPGRYLKNHLESFESAVRGILAAHQITTNMSDLPDWWDRALTQANPSVADYKGTRWYVLRANVEIVANRGTQIYTKPDTSSPHAGKKLPVRTKLAIERIGTVEGIGADGKPQTRVWLIARDGFYLPESVVTPHYTVRGR